PTMSGLYEMCAAGGGNSKLYRLLCPLNPDEVVGGCRESVICYYLPFTFENYTFMRYPVFAIPKPVMKAHFFNWDESLICEDKLTFSNTSQLGLLTFLPKMSIHAMLFH